MLAWQLPVKEYNKQLGHCYLSGKTMGTFPLLSIWEDNVDFLLLSWTIMWPATYIYKGLMGPPSHQSLLTSYFHHLIPTVTWQLHFVRIFFLLSIFFTIPILFFIRVLLDLLSIYLLYLHFTWAHRHMLIMSLLNS